MIPLERIDQCFGCGACAEACKQRAISMQENAEGFYVPVVDSARCIECGQCHVVCPVGKEIQPRNAAYYALRCKDNELLQKSTSGGAFSLLAQKVLQQDGLVCGACFDDDFSLHHELKKDISSMRKSKYVQSDMQHCFVPISKALESGRTVMFSGTPCQCHALQCFLGEKPENLILVSLICRGVMSPGLWRDYISFLQKNGSLQAYDFRDKRFCNDGHTVSYTVSGQETAVSMHQDALSKIYQLALAYRPSCYHCPYCTTELDFDFTIGDFWGIEKIAPELNDGKGVSLVIARGELAQNLLKEFEESVILLSCTQSDAHQPALHEPAKQTILRKLLFQDFIKKDENGHCNISLMLKKYAVGIYQK